MSGNSTWGAWVVGTFLARRNWRLNSFAYLAAVAATGSLLWSTAPVSAQATPSGFRYSGSTVDFIPFETIQANPGEAGASNFKYTGASANFEARINVRDNLSPNLPFGAGGSLNSANLFPGVVLVEFFDPISGGDFVCSGTLTNARTILVAAHCMRGLPCGFGRELPTPRLFRQRCAERLSEFQQPARHKPRGKRRVRCQTPSSWATTLESFRFPHLYLPRARRAPASDRASPTPSSQPPPRRSEQM